MNEPRLQIVKSDKKELPQIDWSEMNAPLERPYAEEKAAVTMGILIGVSLWLGIYLVFFS